MLRIALVCPYSLTIPGGVQAQVMGLARQLRALGHEARVLGPCDGAPPATFVTPPQFDEHLFAWMMLLPEVTVAVCADSVMLVGLVGSLKMTPVNASDGARLALLA